MLDCSKMVSRRCRLQSMVVQERNYIEWTNGDTTVNTSDIREEYLLVHITSWVLSASGETNGRCKRFYGRELPQPTFPRSSLLCLMLLLPPLCVFFEWACWNLFRVFLDSIRRQIPVGLDLASVSCWDVESGSKTNESCVNWRRSIVLRYWRASSRSRRWLLCL